MDLVWVLTDLLRVDSGVVVHHRGVVSVEWVSCAAHVGEFVESPSLLSLFVEPHWVVSWVRLSMGLWSWCRGIVAQTCHGCVLIGVPALGVAWNTSCLLEHLVLSKVRVWMDIRQRWDSGFIKSHVIAASLELAFS